MIRMSKKKIKFLHLLGPDTKTSYGIMTQLFRRQNLDDHKFLITSYESSAERFPKLKEFENLMYIPEKCPLPRRLWRFLYFLKTIKRAEVPIFHSLFFTTNKYVWALFFCRRLLKNAIWIEWGADLYSWQYDASTFKGRVRNYINRKVRESFRFVGLTFPVDELEYRRQFSPDTKLFYTPMPNPMRGDTEQIEYILSTRPSPEEEHRFGTVIQIGHNAFTFSNHFRLMNMLERFKDEDVNFFVPLSYGVYGINGQYGGKDYCVAVEDYAKQTFGDKITVLNNTIEFKRYLQLLWRTDIAVFDLGRPCGLGTMRILILMGKKLFLPAHTPYYDFLVSNGVPIYDTNEIPNMTFEEFIAPPKYENFDWVNDYMNNAKVMEYWDKMFREVEQLL